MSASQGTTLSQMAVLLMTRIARNAKSLLTPTAVTMKSRAAAKNGSISQPTYSFARCLDARSQLASHARKKPPMLTVPEWQLNAKVTAARYARATGLRTPALLAFGVPVDALETMPGTVIKPIRGGGAKGVYAVLSPDEIHEIATGRIVNAEQMRTALERHCAASEGKLTFQIEERINGTNPAPPQDVKFYCFYGEIPLSTVVHRMPEGRNYFTADGKPCKTGRFDNLAFAGDPPSDSETAIAREISLHLPAPFMRIDFLRASNGDLFFGEFTPRPGNYHHQNKATDRLLGEAFMDAELRLMHDLLGGKKFPFFKGLKLNLPQERDAIKTDDRRLGQM